MAKTGTGVDSVTDAVLSMQLEQQADQAKCQEALAALSKKQQEDAKEQKRHEIKLKLIKR